MPRTTGVLAVLLLACVLAGCGTGTGTTTAPPEASASATEPEPDPDPTRRDRPDRPAPVPDSLEFTATTVDGEPFDAASLAGTPVLLWFWAPWCPTCRGQVPQVEGLAAEYDGDLAVVGVGSLDSEAAIVEFAGDVEGVTHLVDTDGALFRRFGIAEQSSFVLLDADGEVAFETGYGGSDELDTRVAGVVGG